MKFTLLACLTLAATMHAFGQAQEKVLYSFGGVPNDGLNPVSALVADGSGNLYGTAQNGGALQGGTVFELTPQMDGTWTETTIYNFCTLSNCFDGFWPQAGLVFDGGGNLYGTASSGGATCPKSSNRCGTAFELSPPQQPGGSWSLSVLYNFCSNFQSGICLDGFAPNSQLVFDASGNLYGTTSSGGMNGFGGVAFELSPGSTGWTETVLYTFCSTGGTCKDGDLPNGLAFDTLGKLFGTTAHGGQFRQGVVFKLTPDKGAWTESVVLNNYINESGTAPISIDAAGNLYNATQIDMYQLNMARQRKRTRTYDATVGSNSLGGVLVDPVRNVLYGTTSVGGLNDSGTLWEVNVARQLVPIYNFCSLPNCADGARSSASLIEDSLGNLYGTTPVGGAYGNGVIFEVTP